MPSSMAWTADITLISDQTISSKVHIVVGDLELDGYALPADPYTNSRSIRVVGGFGGWRKPCKARQYKYDGGIFLKTVLSDLAIEVGESVNIDNINNILIGTNYIRRATTAGQILNELYPNWWISNDGITQLVNRPTKHIKSPYTIINFSGGKKQAIIATETFADWIPNNTFSNEIITNTQTIDLITLKLERSSGTVRLGVLLK
jgi:hypothetical protein